MERTAPKFPRLLVWLRPFLLGLLAMSLTACSILPEQPPPPQTYRLDWPDAPYRNRPGGPVLMVAAPEALGGYRSTAMLYRDSPNALSAFATGVWADPPAQMLAEQTVAALGATGRFAAVVTATDALRPDLRLLMTVLRFEQDYTRGAKGGVARVRVRMQLVDERGGRVLGGRVVSAEAPAGTEGPAAAAAAMSRAARRVVDKLVDGVDAELKSARGGD